MGVCQVPQREPGPENDQVSEGRDWTDIREISAGAAAQIQRRRNRNEMRGAVCLFMKEDAEQGMGKDKMACSSEWSIARGVHSRAARAGTDTIITSK